MDGVLGVATTEMPDYDNGKHREDEIIIPDEPIPTHDNLYMVMGCLFVGFWIIVCLGCAICYRCKQRRGEEAYVCAILN